MRHLSLTGVIGSGLALVLFGVVLHAPFSVGIGSLLPDVAVPLKAWKEVLLGVLAVLLAIVITRRKAWKLLAADRLLQLAAGFAVVHVVLVVFTGGEWQAVAAGLLIDLRFIGAFVLAYVLAALYPQVRRRLLVAVAAGALVVLGFGLLQITVLPDDVLKPLGYSKQTITPYTTIDSNPDFVRINSTLRGPNPLGAVAVIYLSLALALLTTTPSSSPRRRVAAVAGVIASTAVLFASYSRSAYLAAVTAAAAIVLATVRLSRGMVVTGAMVGVVGIVGLVMVSSTDWFSNVILHEDPESSTMAKSNDDHVTSLQTGLERTLAQPFGAGVGSTGSASLYDTDKANDIVIENQYFFVAHESGWLGLGIFLALFSLVMVRLWNARVRWTALGLFASGLGLALIGLLLPVWVDETVALTWWMLVGVELAAISGIIGGRHDTRTRKQASTRTT